MTCHRRIPCTAHVLIVATFASLALILVFGAEAGTPPGVLPGAELLENVQLTVMPAVDVTALLVEDQKRAVTDTPRPLRVGTSLPVSFTPEYSGTWETLADGSRLWRLRIVSPGALNLSLGLDRFDLPSGAALWVHDPDGGYVQGPYTSKNRNRVAGHRDHRGQPRIPFLRPRNGLRNKRSRTASLPGQRGLPRGRPVSRSDPRYSIVRDNQQQRGDLQLHRHTRQ